MLGEIEQAYNSKIRNENVQTLKAIIKLAKSYNIVAIVDINPINGRIITTNHDGRVKIEYDENNEGPLFTVVYNDGGIILRSAAKRNFYGALNDYDMIVSKNKGRL